jgi:NTE family protein
VWRSVVMSVLYDLQVRACCSLLHNTRQEGFAAPFDVKERIDREEFSRYAREGGCLPRFTAVRSVLIKGLPVVWAALSSGCAMYAHTPQLNAWDLTRGYRFEQPAVSPPPAAARNSDDVFVVLAFSGGGTRAASLSYGVLAQLRDVKFHWDPQTKQPVACNEQDPNPTAAQACKDKGRSLLDEVDVISSVSGGSFTAGYYALNHDGIFDENGPFHRNFLYYPVQRDLLGHAVYWPQNWLRLRSRVEIAANDYARNIFGDVTFAALQSKGRPYLILNATDASTGARFEFTQEQFDLICGDLSRVPLARGVAASSAFPGLLNSMTIDSFNARGGCNYRGPGFRCEAATRQCPSPTPDSDWVELAIGDAFNSYRRYTTAREALAYRDPSRTHLHLLDGGLADNIGLRSVLQSLNSTDRPQTIVNGTVVRGGWSLLDKINPDATTGVPQVKTIIVVTVNARTSRTTALDEKSAGPGTFSVINAASGVPMGNFSTETLELLREYGIDAELNKPDAPRFYGVEVAFENLTDTAEREFLSGMGTNFELDRFEVNCLIDRGAKLLRDASSVTDVATVSFADFVRDELKGSITPFSPYPQSCTAEAGRKAIATRGHYIDIGGEFQVTRAASDDVENDKGGGVAVRVAKPNGFGATIGFGTNAFDVPSTISGKNVTLGTLRLRTLSGGFFYARRVGRLEASAGLSGGYGFGGFEVTREARDLFGRAGLFGLEPDATNAWLVKPNASIWHNLTSRIAVNLSASYTMARPMLRVGGGVPDREITASTVQVSTGIAYKVF